MVDIDWEEVLTPMVIFLGVIAAIWIIALSTFGIIKIGSNMFDASPSKSATSSSDAVTGCHESGGTVIAQSGEYKECKLEGKK